MWTGARIADRFELERRAGVGGMGVVWRAIDRASGAPVAIKVLEKPRRRDAERFMREAAVLAELTHPSIVRYVAHGIDEDGDAWIAMEWLEGEDLFARTNRGPLPLEGAIEVGLAIAGALGAAHTRGIVHRDVKPENIFLVDRSLDDARIFDFGVARWIGLSSLTRAGTVLGTPGYMAPEQVRAGADIGPPADVFALGCVLYECLTGKLAYPGNDPTAVLVKVLLEDAPVVRDLRPDVPPVLDSLVSAMLARDPNERPKDGNAVARVLARIAGGARDAPPPARPRETITTRERRIVHLVLAASTRETDPDGVAAASPESRHPDLHALAMSSSARIEYLADGTIAVAITGVGAATDQAARAARIALALRSSLPTIPIALTTGRAIVADAPIPIGEVIDRASSLLGSAPDDAVRLDAASAGLLGDRFEIDHDTDGPILRAEREQSFDRTLLGRPAPFVGRAREISLVRDLIAEAFEQPRARAVLVTAPAGGGKSRFADALLRELDGPDIWIARGDPLSAGSPFVMLGRALRRACNIADGAPREVARALLSERVGRHVGAADTPRVAAFLGEAIGVPFEADEAMRAARMDPRLMNDQVRRAFEDLVRAETDERPLLVVLDDLQWGDRPTNACVDAVLRGLSERPVAVLALARPEVREVLPDLWSARDVSTVALPPLPRHAAEAMVREVLPELDGGTVARIVERSGGSPYYLEELVRAVDAGSVDLPDTIVLMVQTRLEALDAEERRALRAASVFGRTFWDGGVRHLMGAVGDVDRALGRVTERELVTREARGRFAGEIERSFSHDHLVEAAYAMLTPEDRALGHRLAAEWLERAGEPDALSLAEHYERGGQHGPAAECFLRAARQALEGDDLDSTLLRASRGVALGEQGLVLGRLHRVQAEAYMWRGVWAATLSHARQAMALLPPGSAEFFGAVGDASIAAARTTEFGELERAASLLAITAPDDDALESYLVARARTALQFYLLGRSEDARALFDPSADPPSGCAASTAGWIFGARAAAASLRGDQVEHLRLRRITAAQFERAGDRRRFCVALNNVSMAMSELGLLREATIELRQLLETAVAMGLDSVVPMAEHNLGHFLALLGELDEGLAIERRAIEDFARQGEGRLELVARVYAARIALLRGDAERAAQEIADALVRIPKSAPYRPYALAVRACALIELGRSGEAFELADEAKRAADAGELDEGEGLVRLAHVRTLLALDLTDEARASAQRSKALLIERAARIADPSIQKSYLALPDHAALLALGDDQRR